MAVDAREIIIDNVSGGTIPDTDDSFVNGGVTIRINSAGTFPGAVAGQYKLSLDRPIKTAIADNATINAKGTTGAVCPVFVGKPCNAVVQKNPDWLALDAEDEFSVKVRTYMVHDLFVTDEKRKYLQHISFKFRNVSV